MSRSPLPLSVSSHVGRCLALVLFPALAAPAPGQAPLHQRIDRAVAAGLPDFEKSAAPPASDAEFLRRASLDLTGTVPTADQARAFLAGRAPDKRRRLVESLLAGPEYARHMAEVFDVMLLERRAYKDRQGVTQAQWQEFLRAAFAEDRPFDRLAREIITADGFDPALRPAARFNLARQGEPQTLALDISRLFLGMNYQCAQCHDHPTVPGYKQGDFHDVLAFLGRSFLFADPKVVAEKRVAYFAEKADGEVTYKSVFDPSGSVKSARPRLPGGKALKEPDLTKGGEYEAAVAGTEVPKGATYRPPVPRFSRRGQLALRLADRENAPFRRTAANRLWALMMGRGLVHPVDMDHADNPPSHPELLTLLGDEFAAGGFRVRPCLRELALTETYGRSSTPLSKGESVPPDRFAAAAVKPLSPEQLAWSLMRATGLDEAERRASGPGGDDKALRAKWESNVAALAAAFGGAPGQPETFQATLDQTLFMTNGALLRSWLASRPGNLTDRLARLASPDEIAEELFLSILTRMPSGEERKEVADYLKARPKGGPGSLEDLAWALLTSAEFRFNH